MQDLYIVTKRTCLFVYLAILSLSPNYSRAQSSSGSQAINSAGLPVLVSTGVFYQSWDIDEQSISELSIPISIRANVAPYFNIGVSMSRASVQGDGYEDISGITDANIIADYTYQINSQRRLITSLALSIPTGTTKFTSNEYDTAFQLGLPQYGFRVPAFGQGGSAALGISYLSAVTENIVLSAATQLRYKGEFFPQEDDLDPYNWGNEVVISGGISSKLYVGLTGFLDIYLTLYSADEIRDVEVFEPAPNLFGNFRILQELGRNDLQFGFQYKTYGTNQEAFGESFRAESVRSYPGFIKIYSSF